MEKNKNLVAYNPQSLCSQRVMKKKLDHHSTQLSYGAIIIKQN